MAGIGFELKRVATRGGLTAYGQIAFSGILIVAGPWLISILNIFLVQRFLALSRGGASQLLIPVLVYSYALSLGVFGGFHYPFTRLIADFIYKKRESLALKMTVQFGSLLSLGAGSLAFVLLGFFPPIEGFSLLLRILAAAFFASVNFLWVVMLFASALKWFLRVCGAYLAGIVITQAVIRFASPSLGEAGVLLGFLGGHLFISLALLIIGLGEVGLYRGGKVPPLMGAYFRRYALLFWTGFLFNAGIWVDKVVFWFGRGEHSQGLLWPLYASYDTAVYLANLLIIPGLVYFVVISETNFYVLLKKLLHSLLAGTYRGIQRSKYRLIRRTVQDIRDQSLLQGGITASALLVAPYLVGWFIPQSSVLFLGVALGAAYLQLLFLTLMNFHFYLESYRVTLAGAGIFFGLNFTGALATLAVPDLPPGIGFCGAAGAAILFVGMALKRRIRRTERIILSAAGEGRKDLLAFLEKK